MSLDPTPQQTPPPRKPGLLAELRRRRVFRVTGTYVFAGWILMQAGEIVLPAFELPNRALRWLILGLAGGLPLVVMAAWWIDVTPRGIRLTARIDRALAGEAEGSGGEPDAGELESDGEGGSAAGSSLEMIVLGIGLPLVAFGLFLGLLLISPDRQDAPKPRSLDAVAPVSDKPSLAVLPLEEVSSAGEDGGFFAHGMHEDILAHLARVPGLRLISRTSVLSYEGTQKPIREIAAELGVDHILEGSVRRSESHVRVTAQLIRVESDEHIWAEQFDAELSNIFEVQSRIATSIAEALEARVSTNFVQQQARPPSVLPAAYDSYAKARDLHRNADAADRGNLKRSQHLYEEALRADPQFAAGWLYLGMLHADFYWFGLDTSQARADQAVRCVDEAAALGLPQDQLAFAEGVIAYYIDRDYGKALMLFERAVAHAENSSEALFYEALVLRRQGALGEALEVQEMGLSLDPLSLAQQEELALTLGLVGRFSSALKRLSGVLRRDPGRTRAQLQSWQFEAELTGAPGRVVDAISQSPASSQPLEHQGLMFVHSALSGRAEEGAEWLREMPSTPSARGLREVRLSILSRLAGQPDRAKAWLDRADANLAAALSARGIEEWTDLETQTSALIAAEYGDFEAAIQLLKQRTTEHPLERDLIEGMPMLWDLLLMQLRAGKIDEAITSLDRLSSRIALGSVPFGGFLVLAHWPDLAAAREDPRWQRAFAEARPDYVDDWN